MLKSVIEEIYYGNRVFGDEGVETENYKEAEAKFLAAYGQLLDNLPAKLKDELDEVLYLHSGVADAGYAKKFCDGFKLGFDFACEIVGR